MKKILFTLSLVFLALGSASVAHADLEDFLRRVDAQAREDLGRFNVGLSAQFGLPVPRVDVIVKSVPNPADAFMVLQLGLMTGRPPEAVLRTYQANRGKGWGAVAKELGIKPGSREFHALKRGDFVYSGEPGGGSGKGHGKSKGKGKGKEKKHR